MGKKKDDCCKKYKKGKQCKSCPRRRFEESALVLPRLTVNPATTAGANAD
jgi:hypothetical protein